MITYLMKKTNMLKLKDHKWKEFNLNDIFIIGTGAHVLSKKLKPGRIPRISATDNNNGIIGFYENLNERNYREQNNFISISFLGSVFYHPYTASLDMKIHSLQPKYIELNNGIASFFVFLLKRMASVYSYGNQLSSRDLYSRKIFLPVTSQEEPDYDFMEQFMYQREKDKKNVYINFIQKRLSKLEDTPTIPLLEKEWSEFFIEDIAKVQSGERLTKADMIKGNIPFIGATDSNNGVTEYVSNINSSIDRNVLGVNYNGSVVENFYHPYEAVFSDDVKRLSLKECVGNKYLYLFLKTIILQQKSKYQYGYKFNGQRMMRQKIMLPINSKGQPDYEYMERYMKYLERKQILSYLNKYNTYGEC